jgi:hypothetical protein
MGFAGTAEGHMFARFGWVSLPLLLGGCATMEGLEQRWEAWVADHNACEVDEDCVIVSTECPLGCWTAVAAEHEQAAIDKAEGLVRQYEMGGRACAYDCIAVGTPTCDAGACTAAAIDTGL